MLQQLAEQFSKKIVYYMDTGLHLKIHYVYVWTNKYVYVCVREWVHVTRTRAFKCKFK